MSTARNLKAFVGDVELHRVEVRYLYKGPRREPTRPLNRCTLLRSFHTNFMMNAREGYPGVAGLWGLGGRTGAMQRPSENATSASLGELEAGDREHLCLPAASKNC